MFKAFLTCAATRNTLHEQNSFKIMSQPIKRKIVSSSAFTTHLSPHPRCIATPIIRSIDTVVFLCLINPIYALAFS